MPFDYYQRLSRRDRAIYRRSDAVHELVLPDPAALAAPVEAIRRGLARDDRPGVQQAAAALAAGIVRSLSAPPVKVRVLARRPSDAYSELHGLYVAAPGEMPVIRVWMRTAAHLKPVAFRTFLRTLLHEVGHHLDYAHLGLEDSFHTEGFFRRESSLMRQLAPAPPRAAKTAREEAEAAPRPRQRPAKAADAPASTARRRLRAPEAQLALPLGRPDDER